jgi:phosphopantothenoylcysteine synthetase/decarboxylase
MAASSIIGVILDISGSMKQSWKSTRKTYSTKIEAIHDSMVEILRNSSIQHQDKANALSEVRLFCLAAGFVRPVFVNSVEISNSEERVYDETMEKRQQSDIVCDLIALADIVPKKEDINKIKDELNRRWNVYAEEILRGVSVSDDVYEQLRLYSSNVKPISIRSIDHYT